MVHGAAAAEEPLQPGRIGAMLLNAVTPPGPGHCIKGGEGGGVACRTAMMSKSSVHEPVTRRIPAASSGAISPGSDARGLPGGAHNPR